MDEIKDIQNVVNTTQEVVNSDVVNSVKEVANDAGFSLTGSSIFLAIGAGLLVWVGVVYNSLVRFKIKVNEAWSNIDVQLKRRYDLIPNLVETVKGYAKHEKETLEAVIQARNKATQINVDAKKMTAENMAQFAGAQQGLSGALGKLFALSEKYPDLKANENFIELQRELTDTEDKIESARAGYNAAVGEYNTKVEMFPGNIIAKMFGFKVREMFEIDNSEERKNVKVEF